MVSEAQAETGGPNRTPRSEIRPAVSANRKKEPVLLLDLSTSMNWGAADEYGPEWPDPGSRRAIVIEALHGLVRVLEREDSEAAAEQAGGSDELGGLMTHGFGNRHVEIGDLNSSKRAASHRHPWVVRVSIGRIPMGPNAVRYSERILAILRAGGLPPHLAVQGYLLLIATINGFTIDETGVDDSAGSRDGSMSLDPESLQEIADMASDYIASLPADRFPNMTALAGEFAFSDPDERFELLIDIFVDGLARRAAGP